MNKAARSEAQRLEQNVQRISIGAIKDTLWSALTKRKAAGIKGFKLGNRGYIDMLWSGLTKRKPTSIKGFELGNT